MLRALFNSRLHRLSADQLPVLAQMPNLLHLNERRQGFLAALIHWVFRNTVCDEGIVISTKQTKVYPEVTGYFIPTLRSIGQDDLAVQYARYLASTQNEDGSFYGCWGPPNRYIFDTAQVVRGWVDILDLVPELAEHILKACKWLTVQGRPSDTKGWWGFLEHFDKGRGISILNLLPVRLAGERLQEPRLVEFVDKCVQHYLRDIEEFTDFTRQRYLSHFYLYVQEALWELGYCDEAVRGMNSLARFNRGSGAVPAYHDVSWVCAPGQAQAAMMWFRTGEVTSGRRALDYLESLQNPSGGFYGSYGRGRNYYPREEVSWAAKYAIDAIVASLADAEPLV